MEMFELCRGILTLHSIRARCVECEGHNWFWELLEVEFEQRGYSVDVLIGGKVLLRSSIVLLLQCLNSTGFTRQTEYTNLFKT